MKPRHLLLIVLITLAVIIVALTLRAKHAEGAELNGECPTAPGCELEQQGQH